MAYHKQYAYFITQQGVKRVGGTATADSMEEAVQEVMRRHKKDLEIEVEESVIGFRQVRWLYEGKSASVAIWAPAEYFVKQLEKVHE